MSNFRGSYQFTNDIIVRAGTFKIPSGKTLQMRDGYRIYVLEGGTLEVDGGTIQNADVLVKSGGTLNIKNNGSIHLNRYGKLNAEGFTFSKYFFTSLSHCSCV